MANERRKRLMQEALDEALPQDVRQELYEELDTDPDSAAEYQRLRHVDKLLRTAPFEHAPKTLALTIMARLAEGLSQQQLSHLSGLALALALSIVALIMVPLLMGATWLFLNAIGSAAALTGLMHTLVRMLGTLLAGIDSLVDGAQTLLKTYPEMPALMLAIVPVMLTWLARSKVFNRSSSDTNRS